MSEREGVRARSSGLGAALGVLLAAVPVGLWLALRPSGDGDEHTAVEPPRERLVEGPIVTAAMPSVETPSAPPREVPVAREAPDATVSATAVVVTEYDAALDVVLPRAPSRYEGQVETLVSVAQDLRHGGTPRASDAVRAQLEALRRCQQDALDRGFLVAGSLSARLRVDADTGAVSDATVRGTLAGARVDAGFDPSLSVRTCVERVLRGVRFEGVFTAPAPAAAASALPSASAVTAAPNASAETTAAPSVAPSAAPSVTAAPSEIFVQLLYTRHAVF